MSKTLSNDDLKNLENLCYDYMMLLNGQPLPTTAITWNNANNLEDKLRDITNNGEQGIEENEKLKEQIKQLANLAFDCYDQGYCDGEKRHASYTSTHNWEATEEYKKVQEILEDEPNA